jgi:hypothetical protein
MLFILKLAAATRRVTGFQGVLCLLRHYYPSEIAASKQFNDDIA